MQEMSDSWVNKKAAALPMMIPGPMISVRSWTMALRYLRGQLASDASRPIILYGLARDADVIYTPWHLCEKDPELSVR
jgi:hypothetical protein